MLSIASFEDADRAQEVWKRAQVTAALEDKSWDYSWEVENRSMLICSSRSDKIVDSPDHFLEGARPAVEAVDAGLDE
jgi:hypothetical protein